MRRALVTGGGGFVGSHIVRQLLAKGVECTVLGRNDYPDLTKIGVKCIVGDISDPQAVLKAAADVDMVFHVAALAGIWGKWQEYERINITGTKNVLAACKENNIKRLVYTSTPSVVFNGDDIIDGDESLPYAENFLCHYAKSKVLAEKLVLSANCRSLLCCAIRPHLVWGPGDPHLIPRLLDRGRRGELKRVGQGTNIVDISYVENVAAAHILAADNLETTETAAGNAYFISQGEPVNLWSWINELFARFSIPQISHSVPFPVAYGAGAVLEAFHRLFLPEKEPKMTRFVAEQLAKSHSFSINNAQRDLGYEPVVSTEEGMKRLMKEAEQS